MPQEDIKRLRNARGQCKGAITRLEAYFNQDKSFDISDIEVREQNLISNYQKFQQIQLDILCQGGGEEDDETCIIEERYLALCSKLRKIKQSVKREEQCSDAICKQRVHLPPINIKPYDGKDVSGYKQFMDLFTAVIDKDTKLSNVEKFYYLKSLLTSEPLQLIEGLSVCNDSYRSAISLLNKRYDNDSLLINSHINTLLDLPIVQKGTAPMLRDIVSRIRQHTSALQNLKQPIEQWGPLLVCILIRKLDPLTIRLFHAERDTSQIATLESLLDFISKRAASMEASSSHAVERNKSKSVNLASIQQPFSQNKMCLLCGNNQIHKLFKCPKFNLLPISKKLQYINSNHYCKICLCKHKSKCRLFKQLYCKVCKEPTHNSLICNKEFKAHSTESDNLNCDPEVNLHSHRPLANKVLLPTVKVLVSTSSGDRIVARGILDSGSQSSFCTSSLADKLGIQQFKLQNNIATIGNNINTTQKAINLELHSMTQNYSCNVTCSVIHKISQNLPQRKINTFSIPKNIPLSDPEYNQPGEIHLLLGASIFFRVLQNGKIEGGPSDPILLNTKFGYIISGDSFHSNACNFNIALHTVMVDDLDSVVRRFWETEKVPEIYQEVLPENEYSETIFKESVKLEENVFSVKYPLKAGLNEINTADSFSIALQRFYNLEKRFSKDPEYFNLYKEFINEYIRLGHAKLIPINLQDDVDQPLYFLSHHAVLRMDKNTNKLRCVFDGTAKCKNKNVDVSSHSLNDMLCNGPVVQKHLFDILLQFRTFKFVLMCDIRHMYRCILIYPEHRVLQNILWRESPDLPILCLQLQTITYGLKSSAYLATRCLVELALRFQKMFPLASKAILQNSYVDDILCGAPTMEKTVQLKNELIELLMLGNFQLHKWCSNNSDLITDIPKDKLGFSQWNLDQEPSTVKTLGVAFDTKDDMFKICGNKVNCPEIPTKRSVLSAISRFFDPLGFAGPITVKAKLILQQIWQCNMSWDTPLPNELAQIWHSFQSEISNMKEILIPRNVQLSDCDECELIGFCDSSNVAFGCVIYVKVQVDGQCHIHLLCSKSRIAPLNSKLTIPKLELNGALLLSNLMNKVSSVFPDIKNISLFTDSNIVLGWLNSVPIKLPAYIGNRTKEIIKLTSNMKWFHTPGLLNPADILTRGSDVNSIHSNQLWWNGPDYLQNNSSYNLHLSIIEIPYKQEYKNIDFNICSKVENNDVLPIFTNYSSLYKLQRIVCYMLRFINKGKGNSINSGFISAKEMKHSLSAIIKGLQLIHFSDEIMNLKKGHSINSNLKSLHPFLDENGLLRVGGRLQNSSLSFAKKFPIILPNNAHVTRLIIRNEHLTLLHAGLKLVSSSLSQRYHLINSTREIKAVINKCVICQRFKAESAKQLMGSLPKERVTPGRIFQNVGLDYCGPFSIKVSTLRRTTTTKGYVVVFVCMATKAVHMEVVSDLTTDAFLAAFKRFISRKSVPSIIFSDNAATLKGANNQLKALYDLQNSNNFQNRFQNFLSMKGISFKFIPVYSPNHGGLWESCVKSAKHHLKRVAGSRNYTFEQFNTIICQIESILNSRPLMPLSQDTSDYSYLTPGHFLVGCPLNSYPEENLENIPNHRLRIWRLCEQTRQHFWRAWSNEYLSTLNNRTKWMKEFPNIKEGMIVLLRDQNTSPLYWPLGRVSKVYLGPDSKVRVVQVRTSNGKLQDRAISKIVVLPVDDY